MYSRHGHFIPGSKHDEQPAPMVKHRCGAFEYCNQCQADRESYNKFKKLVIEAAEQEREKAEAAKNAIIKSILDMGAEPAYHLKAMRDIGKGAPILARALVGFILLDHPEAVQHPAVRALELR